MPTRMVATARAYGRRAARARARGGAARDHRDHRISARRGLPPVRHVAVLERAVVEEVDDRVALVAVDVAPLPPVAADGAAAHVAHAVVIDALDVVEVAREA